MKCPECFSENIRFRPNRNNWICDDCDNIFTIETDTPQYRIFVSYGHDEYTPFAREVADKLKEKGFEVVFDEKKLKTGEDWELSLEHGLQWVKEAGKNGRFILIMTPYSVRRPNGYCLNEIAYALDCHIPIVPIMLVWTTPPLSIYRLQWLDLMSSLNKNVITDSFETEFQKITHVLDHLENMDNAGVMNRLMDELDPLDFSGDILIHQPWFVGREWIFHDIRKWLAQKDASRIYWLTGLPGIGKTSISVHLLQKCPNIVAFHLCIRGHSEKSSPKRTVCSLAFQLSKQLPEYREKLVQLNLKREIDRCNDSALFDVLMVEPLQNLSSPTDAPLVILIDGLDEASVDSYNPMVEFIASYFCKLPSWLRFIITSRPVEEVLVPLQEFSPKILDAESYHNLQDIELYLDKRLKLMFVHDDWSLIKSKILEKSEGVFLYVKYVCDEWFAKDVEIENIDINLLPNGLGAIYADFFRKRFPKIDYYREKIRPILQLISAAPESLSIDEVATFLNIHEDEINDFLIEFSSFIYLDDRDYIHPFHASLIDWLCDKKRAGHLLWIDKVQGEKLLMNWLWNLFKQSDYNFFYEGKCKNHLQKWLPMLLMKHGSDSIDTMALVGKYLLQLNKIRDKGEYIDILTLLLSDRQRFSFSCQMFRYVFQQEPNDNLINWETSCPVSFDSSSHWMGVKFLFLDVKGKEVPVSVRQGFEYYYFTDYFIPSLYTTDLFDVETIFRGLKQGIIAAFDDGRISSLHHFMLFFWRIATTYYKKNIEFISDIVQEIIDEFEKEDSEWDREWAERMKSMKKILYKNGE
mgnify:CR=1 FL=1